MTQSPCPPSTEIQPENANILLTSSILISPGQILYSNIHLLACSEYRNHCFKRFPRLLPSHFEKENSKNIFFNGMILYFRTVTFSARFFHKRKVSPHPPCQDLVCLKCPLSFFLNPEGTSQACPTFRHKTICPFQVLI